ncbi:MAG: adenosylmethionine--8-amino-7-oxononanoate transaminase [Bacteroidetes bacterium]|nr:MAG: adenosylmethionine--8-amino-7-oxononanoate transaminase [Bacteroidota bacterium]PTM10110.1 MAG: adenosylmethionine--8-amino-7-oxononanoate transaminase [Bacteroidota bacterium]
MPSLTERDQQVIWHPYTQMKTAGAPLPIVRGAGSYLYHEDGTAYLDAVSSWWVNLHGHAHPYIAEQVSAQLLQLEHVIFAGFTHPPAVTLAERLLQHLPSRQARIFYSDNGSTAVEIGIKMARQYYYNQGEQQRCRLVAFEEAFHGETFGAMSASGDHDFNRAFQDQFFEVWRIPAPTTPDRARQALALLEGYLQTGEVYAFLFEPLVLGAGGMLMYEASVLDELIACCHRYGALCIADEVMTGFGRTGRTFACDYLREQPDIMCLSKGLTGGTLPLAVTTCSAAVFDAFWSEDKLKAFFHGHSYTANPVGCAAALASLDLLESRECQENIARISARHQAFRATVVDHPALVRVQQTGTILALEFATSSQTSYFNSLRDQLYYFFMERGILLRPLGNVIYVLPPYCTTDEQLADIYAAIQASFELVEGFAETVDAG